MSARGADGNKSDVNMFVTLEVLATFRSVLNVLSLSLRFKKVALLGFCIVNEIFEIFKWALSCQSLGTLY